MELRAGQVQVVMVHQTPMGQLTAIGTMEVLLLIRDDGSVSPLMPWVPTRPEIPRWMVD